MEQFIKKLTVSPDVLLAGDSYQLDIIIELCKSEEKIRMLMDLPAYLGSSRPSLIDQEDSGYFEVVCSNPAITAAYDVWDMETDEFQTVNTSSFKGMAQRIIIVDVTGCRDDGDTITIKLGYTRDGMGVGYKAPTVILNDSFQCPIDVFVYDSSTKALPYYGREIAGWHTEKPRQTISANYRVLPREAVRLKVMKSETQTILKGIDRFGNSAPISVEDETDICTYEKLPNQYVYEIPSHCKVTSRRLPINHVPEETTVSGTYHIYFGDIHTHSCYSNDTIEREKMQATPYDLLKYARDVACLDFAAVTDHHQPWDIERNRIGEKNWVETVEMVKRINDEGFVAYCGFENRDERGDTAVVFSDYPAYDAISSPELSRIDKIWERLSCYDYITIPHFHNPGSLESDKWIYEDSRTHETVLEIYSCHGSYECKIPREKPISKIKTFRHDRCGRYFLNNGYMYGFVANSDGHKGIIGCSGITAVLAENLSKSSIFDAIRNRRTYLTSGARISLYFEINGGIMGSVISPDGNAFALIKAEGEQPIKYVEIITDGKQSHFFLGYGLLFEKEVTMNLKNASYVYIRVVQEDDHFAVSSPVFIRDRQDQ